MRLFSSLSLNSLSNDEKILFSKAKDMSERSNYQIEISDFLTPREQIVFYNSFMKNHTSSKCYFWGGALSCERRCAVMLPEWYLNDSPNTDNIFDIKNEQFIASIIENKIDDGEISNNIKSLYFKGSSYVTLTHRDYLGSILGLGIKRDVLGDIAVYNDYEARVFVKDKISAFILDTMTHCKNDVVKIKKEDFSLLEMPHMYKNAETIVQSLRLDGIVKSLTNLSREDAAELVKAGKVDVNYFTETESDFEINTDDIISIHGFGKYIIDGIEGHTKSGKIKLKSRKYV